ncbi:DUF982 domain-containing protein [Mesorhizobium sp. M0136]|uniref:DUF982 domain-containing protein n=1 Tax=Mesorhizobium sp. M0136 TaxID=2956890 RepID=UPI00333603F0
MYEAALTACFDAYNGRIPASAARKTFFRFGEQVAILEDATSAMQWLAACMSGSGKAQVSASQSYLKPERERRRGYCIEISPASGVYYSEQTILRAMAMLIILL